MAYHELEQFLGRGEEKLAWIISARVAAGIALGGFLGHRLGTIVWGPSFAVAVPTLIGALIGALLTMRFRGIMVARRLLIRGLFVVQSLNGTPVLNGLAFCDSDADTPEGWGTRLRVHEHVAVPEGGADQTRAILRAAPRVEEGASHG